MNGQHCRALQKSGGRLHGFSALSVGAACLSVLATTGVSLAQPSQSGESAALGTPKWFLQTLPAELPADGNRPDASLATQLLPALGRDDLWASRSHYSKYTCEAVALGGDSIAQHVAELAKSTRIVIINEAHDIPWHRRFTESLLSRLWDEGYRYLAAEAFLEHINDHLDEEFGRIDVGFYATESTFGDLIRAAKRIGYVLVPYEALAPQGSTDSVLERMTRREEGEATHLMERVFRRDPIARVIVHVGFSHAAEVPIPSSAGATLAWMAARLKAKSGIDPLTIDQTYCSSAGSEPELAKPTDQVPAGAFDLAIAYPEITTTQGRATWRLSEGRRLVPLPSEATPSAGRAIVEARHADEPDVAIPVDRLLLRAGESLPLVLPPGTFRLTVTAEGSAESKAFQLSVE
jgi:hypothetical protein